jgi:transcriptional regulator with XRE-family HTH domain
MTIPSEDRFGDLLRRLRTASRLSQAELAERAHLSVRGTNHLERRACTAPRRETVRLLADFEGLGEPLLPPPVWRTVGAGNDTDLRGS